MKKFHMPTEKLNALFDAVQKLSRLQRILIVTSIFLLAVGAFYYFSFMPKQAEIEKLTAESEKLDRKLNTARITAMSKPKFVAEMQAATEKFVRAKAALPEKQEIPSLLTSISQSGQDAGLEFLLFKPGNEASKDFFAEIPVEMTIVGGYHQVGVFFDKVSNLSRIVTIRNINMTTSKEPARLTTSCTAVTYRFVESPPDDAKGNGGKK